MTDVTFAPLLARIKSRTAVAGIIGLGYVGLPLAVTAAKRGVRTIGFDIDPQKIQNIEKHKSYIEAVKDADLLEFVSNGSFAATTDFAQLSSCDIIVICVPTPLTQNRDPDLSFIRKTCEDIAANIKPGTLVSLESTTYPGTVQEVVTPILETSGLLIDKDIFVAFSPEREDPGNKNFNTFNIPKIVGADSPEARELAVEFYSAIVEKVISVSTAATAEAVKITENVFRSVNIALVNELKVIYTKMGIDVWEIIDAASTKPFGYMPFYPGPGLGGHCIPIDPFYLSWKAREHELSARFIELAGEINVSMVDYVVTRLREGLDREFGRGLNGARVLISGLSYKKNISDMRESPAVKVMTNLIASGANVDYYDPHVPEVPKMRNYPELFEKKSVTFEQIPGGDYHAIVITTDHDVVDYAALAALDILIVDTRNVLKRKGVVARKVVKA